MIFLFDALLILLIVGMGGFSFLLFLNFIFKGYHAAIRWTVKRAILKNPLVGYPEGDTFVYLQKGYKYRYQLIQAPKPHAKAKVVWISRWERTDPLKKKLSDLHRFWGLLSRVLYLDMRVMMGALMLCVGIFYVCLIPVSAKEVFLTEVAKKVTGLPLRVKAEEKGKIRIMGQQQVSGGGKAESFDVVVDPIEWVFSGKPAYVTRYGGGKPATYEVYRDGGNVTFTKDGHQIVGHPRGKEIVWEGEGVTGKVSKVNIPNEAELRKMINEQKKTERRDGGKSSD